jgi:hypothetical protein
MTRSFFVTDFSEYLGTLDVVGRISYSRCTSHVAATASGSILVTYRSRIMVSSPTVVSRSAFRHPSNPPQTGQRYWPSLTLWGSFTWRAGIAALWIAFVEDTAASTYDFHATHGKTSLCKNRFHMFT